jgi:hydroxypyruvate isomerase
MPGLKDYGLSRQDQQLELIDNLLWAATRSGDVVLNLEALNDTDVPDYFYASPQQALSVLNACQRPNLGLQFDFYHVVKQGLDLNEQLQACLPWVRHVQVAGSPQRHEPVLEQHGLLAGFRQLHESGYSGFVGCEYRPAAQASDGLAWMQPLLELGWATLD